jgi:Fe-S-cluster containining protein
VIVHCFSNDICSDVMGIYHGLDLKTAGLQLASGLCCPPECGVCCKNSEVEATVLEALPAAEEIYRRRAQEAVLCAIEKTEKQGDSVCVLYRPDLGIPGNGRCRYYEFRPLLCRLFGFASRRNKFGDIELCTCKIIKERNPEAVHRAEMVISEGFDVPVYHDTFMRVASVDPGKGYRRLPINLALKEALQSLYWTRPADLRDSKALVF